MFVSLTLGAYFTLSIYYTLRKIRTKISTKTYELYRKLINILLFELTLGVAFGGIPTFVMTLSYTLDLPYSMSLTSLSYFMGECLPLISVIGLLLYIEPYRK